jgi:hypothetical protein
MPKRLTFDQVADRKQKAEDFLRNVIGDDDRADEVAAETVEDYADRRHFDIADDPQRRNPNMANGQTKQELLDQIADLQDDNSALQNQLDAISNILGGDDDTDDTDDDGD